MTLPQLFALDLIAISVLVFAVYFPRHRRRDMVVALLGINIGVLGVTQALSSTGISAGLGLGLFGVLSIIRLRSTEMDQGEVAGIDHQPHGLPPGHLRGDDVGHHRVQPETRRQAQGEPADDAHDDEEAP